MELSILYNIDAKGKNRIWEVKAEGCTLITTYGLVGGKLITTRRNFDGVNKGKKNETTAEEQTELEAQRAWKKQIDKGYSVKDDVKPRICKELSTNSSDIKIIHPMLAQKYDDSKKCQKYFNFEDGVYAQPKFDGWRCVSYRLDMKVMMHSRNTKQFPWLVKIKEELMNIFKIYTDVIFDGEIFAHGFIDIETGEIVPTESRFSLISGACSVARTEPSPYDDQLHYYIYDIIDETKSQKDRNDRLTEIFKTFNYDHIHLVDNIVVHDKSKINSVMQDFIGQGYEGLILRAKDGKYECKKRSHKLCKLKEFEDAEFEIYGAFSGEGTEKGCVVWKCKCKNGEEFDVRPRGTQDERKILYKNRKKYIGKLLTVRYQELSADGVPRFPVGIAIREDL